MQNLRTPSRRDDWRWAHVHSFFALGPDKMRRMSLWNCIPGPATKRTLALACRSCTNYGKIWNQTSILTIHDLMCCDSVCVSAVHLHGKMAQQHFAYQRSSHHPTRQCWQNQTWLHLTKSKKERYYRSMQKTHRSHQSSIPVQYTQFGQLTSHSQKMLQSSNMFETSAPTEHHWPSLGTIDFIVFGIVLRQFQYLQYSTVLALRVYHFALSNQPWLLSLSLQRSLASSHDRSCDLETLYGVWGFFRKNL